MPRRTRQIVTADTSSENRIKVSLPRGDRELGIEQLEGVSGKPNGMYRVVEYSNDSPGYSMIEDIMEGTAKQVEGWVDQNYGILIGIRY